MAARKKPVTRRRKKRRKSASGSSGGLPWKMIAVIALSVGVLSALGFGARHFFKSSSFFSINEIVVNSDQSYSFQEGKEKLNRLYLGHNIFSVNLKQVQTLIRNNFPRLRKVEVSRVLPNRLNVDIISRKPAAVIESGRGVMIDSEAVVLDIGGESEGLIKIKGISFFLKAPDRGTRIENKRLDKALVFIAELKKKMWSRVESIEYIDVSNKNNIILKIKGVQVKMGSDDFSGKIDDLNRILRDPDISMEDIRCIDLRFADAVIAPK